MSLSLQVSFSPGTLVNTLLCGLYSSTGGLKCHRKFAIDLDAYQIHEEEMASDYFFLIPNDYEAVLSYR